MAHDMLSTYSVKALEYGIAIGYLLLFVPFWRFLNGAPATERVLAAEPGVLGQMAGWFRVPDHLYFHPGHAWAGVGAGQLVTVGIDDFAQKLVGKVSAVQLPAVGTRVGQGERAWTLTSGARSVDMLSPVDGTVVAVNDRIAASPELLERDPYGDGWLLQVRSARTSANVKSLLSGSLAKHWIEESWNRLVSMMSPELGLVYQDGGLPVDGMARSLDAVRWDQIARRFLLT
jgi:glycine cleavage system H lipoate-binding protein